MDHEPYADTGFMAYSTSGNSRAFSGMFSDAQNFAIAGGSFNLTNHYTIAPTGPSGFRMIPLGDIDLQHQIRFNNNKTGVVHLVSGPRVRRVYSAKIGGRNMIVKMYEGPGAEEEWRQDIATYMSLRQIYGATSFSGTHATVFHDDLIPFKHFTELYKNSHFKTVHIYAYCTMEFLAAKYYIDSVFCREQPSFERQEESDYTLWMRPSTGRLCVDLAQPSTVNFLNVLWPSGFEIPSLTGLNTETSIIDSLALEDYHLICYYDLRQSRSITVSTRITVTLGAVLFWPESNRFKDSVEVAFLPDRWVSPDWEIPEGVRGEVTATGWTRYSFKASDTFDNTIQLYSWSEAPCWLSQANHIFSRIQVTSNFKDYAVVDHVFFDVKILEATKEPPPGYLFLCPDEDFRVGPASFGWPECPAYWSLDPSGVEHLTAQDATRLGFPSIQLTTVIFGQYWDDSVYPGLRKFHQSKNFDPESQDVARHLGYLGDRIFQLSNDHLFAHGKTVDEEINEADNYPGQADDQDESGMDLDENPCLGDEEDEFRMDVDG
ncbi:hypothetical protein B0H19DRAFT_1275854 [Mycena capillaripes]|nr:hypothetical protein B0H19DRAFT_1275854 [Mycena capillaripes]